MTLYLNLRICYQLNINLRVVNFSKIMLYQYCCLIFLQPIRTICVSFDTTFKELPVSAFCTPLNEIYISYQIIVGILNFNSNI